MVLTRAFNGTLYYTVSGGTATAGSDYMASSGSVAVAGSTVEIPITLLDDTEIEQAETIELRLELEDGYAVQEPLEHTIYLNDNDGIWTGMYENEWTRKRLDMTIVHSEAGYQGTFISDGRSHLPEGEWEADIESTADGLTISVSGIPVSAETTALGASFTRSFVFEVVPGEQPYIPDSVFAGQVTETITPDDAALQHLARTMEGVFILGKVGTDIDVPEPVLEPVP